MFGDQDETSVALEALIDAPVGWWKIRDPETTWWSHSMYSLHGIDPSRGVPTTNEIFDLYHPDDTNLVAQVWRKLFTTDAPHEMHYRVRRSDGAIRRLWTRAQKRPPDARGERWIVGLSIDITDHISDRDLFESERAFRFVAENTHDMVIRSRMGGGISYVSPSSRAVLGYEPSDMIGRETLDFLHPDELDRVRSIITDRVRRNEPVSAVQHEYRALHKDGRVIWLEGNPRLVFNGAGRLTEFVDVVRDITARKDTEAALAAALAASEAAAAAKSEFLANMSHELRTPLTSILGFSGLIAKDAELSAATRRHIELVSRAGETLLAVVNDILEFSKLEAGSVQLELRTFDLDDTVKSVVELLQTQADAKGLLLSTSVPTSQALVGDPTRLGQVLLNLIGNAIKFTESGSVHISVAAKPVRAGQSRIRFEIKDTGVGLTPVHIERLFERFTQADSSVSRRYGGTGLGLAISKRIVELMGGQIGADSNGSNGSTFWFEIELDQATSEVPDQDHTTRPAVVEALRVLVAEDNPSNQILIAAILAPFDIELVTVGNGAEAVETCRQQRFDVVLMDMQMPVMDGLKAAQTIRAAAGAERFVPIIALTANVMPEQVQACLQAGMQMHLAKPIDPSALIQAISDFARCEGPVALAS